MPTPLVPKITKSTAPAIIMALFPKTSDLLKRFEVAKGQASIWDGERDGLREVVKNTPDGQYDNVILTKTKSAPVSYPNAEGKYHLESTLITTIPAPLQAMIGTPVIALQCGLTPEELVDRILSLVQGGKHHAVNHIAEIYLGKGQVIDNDTLYKAEGSVKSSIVILPEV